MKNDYDAPENEAYDPNEEPDGLRWMSTVVVALVVLGFFSLAWYAYETSTEPENEGELTLIEADKTPVRERPEDAGGMEFPHQDKEVYNTIVAGGDKKPAVEQLMPAAEAPLERPAEADAAPAALGTQEEKKAMPAEDKETPAAKEEPKPQEIAPIAKEEPKPQPVETPKVEAPKVETPKMMEKPAPAKPKPAATGKAAVQLGALRSNAEAESLWNKLSAQHEDLLSGKSHQVVKADLGAKGVYYRLRVTGVADAAKLCQSLQSRGQSCMPVK